MLRARAEMPGDKDDCVACPCRLQTRWGRDGGRSGATAPPIPPPRQHDGSALTGISPSVRTRDNPPRCASASPFWYFLLESHGICLDGKKHVSLVVFGFRFQVFSKEKCKACSFVNSKAYAFVHFTFSARSKTNSKIEAHKITALARWGLAVTSVTNGNGIYGKLCRRGSVSGILPTKVATLQIRARPSN